MVVPVRVSRFVAAAARDAEVDHGDAAVVATPHVARFDVAVDHAAAVGGAERGGGGDDHGDRVVGADPRLGEAIGEALAVEPGQDHVAGAAGGLAAGEDARDPGMIDGGEEGALAFGAGPAGGIAEQHLERDAFAAAAAAGAIDDGGAAGADGALDHQIVADEVAALQALRRRHRGLGGSATARSSRRWAVAGVDGTAGGAEPGVVVAQRQLDVPAQQRDRRRARRRGSATAPRGPRPSSPRPRDRWCTKRPNQRSHSAA